MARKHEERIRDYRQRELRPRHWIYTILPPFSALTDWIGLIIMYCLVIIYVVVNPTVFDYDIRHFVWALFCLFVILVYSFREYDRVAYRTSLKGLLGDKGCYTVETFSALGDVPGVKYREKGKEEKQVRPPMKAWVITGKDKPFHITGRVIAIAPEELVYTMSDSIIFNVKFKLFSMRYRDIDEDIVDTLIALEHKKFTIDTPIFMGWTPVNDPNSFRQKALELVYDPVAQDKYWKDRENKWIDYCDSLLARIEKMKGKPIPEGEHATGEYSIP